MQGSKLKAVGLNGEREPPLAGEFASAGDHNGAAT